MHDIVEVGDSFQVAIVKRLSFGKGELLEGHAWSSDDEIFAVAGCKIYLSKVSSCDHYATIFINKSSILIISQIQCTVHTKMFPFLQTFVVLLYMKVVVFCLFLLAIR